MKETDKKARGHIDLSKATVTPVMKIKDKDFSFTIQLKKKGENLSLRFSI